MDFALTRFSVDRISVGKHISYFHCYFIRKMVTAKRFIYLHCVSKFQNAATEMLNKRKIIPFSTCIH